MLLRLDNNLITIYKYEFKATSHYCKPTSITRLTVRAYLKLGLDRKSLTQVKVLLGFVWHPIRSNPSELHLQFWVYSCLHDACTFMKAYGGWDASNYLLFLSFCCMIINFLYFWLYYHTSLLFLYYTYNFIFYFLLL